MNGNRLLAKLSTRFFGADSVFCKKSRKGFSFIEILIAAGIFCIALLPLLPSITQSQRNAEYAEKTYRAQLHAQGMMTYLRAEASANVNATAGVNEPDGANITASAEFFSAAAAEYELTLYPESKPYGYGVWYDNMVVAYKPEFPSQIVNSSLSGINGKLITVLVWDERGLILGRASGVIAQ